MSAFLPPFRLPERFRLSCPAPDLIAGGILASLFGWLIYLLPQFGISWDMPVQKAYGDAIRAYYASGGENLEFLRLYNLYYYNSLPDLIGALLIPLLPLPPHTAQSFLLILWGMAGLIGTWKLARHIGGPIAGLCALVLLGLTPAWFGHTPINPKDIPFATAHIWMLYALIRAMEEVPRISTGRALTLGGTFGLVLSIRAAGGFVVLYILLGLAAALFLKKPKKPGKALIEILITCLLPTALIGAVFLWISWPFLHFQPVEVLRKTLTIFSQFPWTKPAEILRGSRLTRPSGHIVLLFLLKKLPFFLWAIFLPALLTEIAKLPKEWKNSRAPAILIILTACLFPPFYIYLAQPVLYDDIRQILFLLPPLCILGGLWCARMLNALSSRLLRYFLAGAFLAACGYLATSLVHMHPYAYTYMNAFPAPLFLDLANISRTGHDPKKINLSRDYWGVSYREAVRKLEEETEHAPANISVCAPVHSATSYFPSRFQSTRLLSKADYLLHTREKLMPGVHGIMPVVATVRRNNTVLSTIRSLKDAPESFLKEYSDPVYCLIYNSSVY